MVGNDAMQEHRRSALIRLMNMLTLNQVNALGEDDMVLIFGKVGEIHIEEHLRAYGKPGANPKMVVPEKRVAFVSNTKPEARDES